MGYQRSLALWVRHWGIFILFLALTLLGCAPQPQQTPPVAVQGVLDLRQADLSVGVVNLSGEWAFYWQQLLSPQTPPPAPTTFAIVPSRWNDLKVMGQPIPGQGYATYRLTILLAQVHQPLALNMPEVETAYQLYVNGQLLSSNGVVGTTPDTMTPYWLPKVVAFTPENNQIELLLQISNFEHRNGGPGQLIQLGSEDTIRHQKETSLAFTLFLIGSITIMGIYHLGLFAVRRKDKTPLYFSLLCLLVAIRSVVSNDYYISDLIPHLPWWAIIKLSYVAIYLAVPTFITFIFSLYPAESSLRFNKFLILLAALFTSFVLLTPPSIYTHSLPFYHLVILVMICYSFGVLLLASLHGQEGALVFLGGFIILFIVIINDILVANQFLSGGYYTPLGMFIFMFAQAFLISMRFSKAFTQVETLSTDLEQRVMERTQYLQTLNDQMRDELALARQMQYSLLPPPHPDWPLIDIICYMTPANEVGGDFYDYYKTDQGRFVVAVGDVSGKGVSAALLMATSIAQFDATSTLNLSPRECMVYLDNAIRPYTQPRRQNCALCYVEIVSPQGSAGTLRVVNAGCIPPYIKRRTGGVEHLDAYGFALGQGLGAEMGYKEVALNLYPGDTVILVSDGVIEANNGVGEMLGFDRFHQMIDQVSAETVEVTLEQIKEAVFHFIGEAEPHDDITIVVMRV